MSGSDAPAAGATLRARAAELNLGVVDGGRSLNALPSDIDGISDRDRPLLRAMLSGSLRWHHRFQWMLSRLLDKPLKRRDRLLGALLRVGLTQLAVLRIPDHAAVSATVAATSLLGLSRAGGLVNAVLRRYIRERDALDRAMLADDVARFSHPRWLLDAIRTDWPDRHTSILEANNVLPPMWLRINRMRISREDCLAMLGESGITASVDATYPDAVLLDEPIPIEALPGFTEGLVSVQDAAAQRVVDLVEPETSERILDACAAPGGKSAHLLERCSDKLDLVALDSDAERLEQVNENLDRLGLTATVIAGDAADPAGWYDGRPFDRVLVDAPCSGSGVIRRHPDIKVLRRASDLPALAAAQSKILDAVWSLLKPAGRLVYVTCSVLKAENIDVVEAFVARTSDASAPTFGGPRHWQQFPGETRADGFYYACLSKGPGAP